MKRFLSAALLALASAASFADAPITATCSTGDFTIAADACAGAFSGNDSGNAATLVAMSVKFAALDPFLPTNWQLIDKTDDGPGILASITTDSLGSTGTLTFSQAITGAFGISLKAGNAHSIYLFNSVDPTPISSLEFTTIGTSLAGNGRTGQDLSHASLWSFVDTGTNSGGGCGLGNICQPVPEPSTYALMGVGLAALGLFSRRRKQ